MNLLRQIQTELFDVSSNAAGTGYGSCQQIHYWNVTNPLNDKLRKGTKR